MTDKLRDRYEVDIRLFGWVVTLIVLLAAAMAENAFGHIPAVSGHAPRFTLVVLFILCLFHASSLGLVAVFMAGLVFDLTEGNPPGYTSALMLLVHLWVQKRRRILDVDHSARIWNEFIAVMGIVMVLTYCALLGYSGNLPAIQPLLLQYALTVLSFPIALWLYQATAGFMSIMEGRR